MLDRIIFNDLEYAIIVRCNYNSDGINFFTDSSYSQQLGYMNRPKGYKIQPHKHLNIKRNIHITQEVLFIKSGKVKVNFYSNDHIYITSSILEKGDVILLSQGGHGFEMIEDSEIIEVKQGPYNDDSDKERFEPTS